MQIFPRILRVCFNRDTCDCVIKGGGGEKREERGERGEAKRREEGLGAKEAGSRHFSRSMSAARSVSHEPC